MKRAAAISIALALCACATAPIGQFPSTPEQRFPSSQTELLVPSTPGRHPAVVLLHTCGGMAQHMRQWGNRFLFENYVVLMVDSFGPRGVKWVCGQWQVSVDQVAADGLAAAAHLRKLPFVDPDRVYAAGFSYGAMAGLRLASAGYLKRQGNAVPFRAIAAFYPYCLANFNAPPSAAERGNNFYFDIATPLHLFLGGADTEAPSGDCASHAEGRKRDGQPVSYTLFPGVSHAFDQQAPSKGYYYDLDAVTRSWEEMRAFFAK